MIRMLGRLSAVGVQSVRERGYYGDGGGLYLRVAPGGAGWIMKAKPDPAAVMADLRVLDRKLSNAFKTESNDPDAMQLRFSVALTAVANFLTGGAGIDEEIAHKFIELASGMKEGSLPFLHPPKANGRTYDSQALWAHRACVVIGLECILRSRKKKLQEAARYIAKEYPDFNRLKGNPSHSLATSIISWRRYFGEGRGYEYFRAKMAEHYQSRDPTKMFEYGESVLKQTAKVVAQAAL